jgi:hypothetical protein|tara:strand:- start:55 stop:318 length:264 start_codon:yes stop_codon:yes gene_type:complete
MIDLHEAAKNLISIPEDIAKDPLVKKICERMINRSNAGIKKYGNTMSEANIGIISGLDNAIEEALDLAVYLEDVKLKLINVKNKYKK